MSKSQELEGTNLITVLPYTRVLQTAVIISKNTGLDIAVESEVHEWFCDTEVKYYYNVEDTSNACIVNKSVLNKDEIYRFEEYQVIRKCVLKVLKYIPLDKVIVV